MRVASGKVIDGKVVVAGDALSEGATVTVLARDDDETFEASPEQEAALLSAIAEAERGDFVSSDQLLASLHRSV